VQKAISRWSRDVPGRSGCHEYFKVNNMEMTIDEECDRILATRATPSGDPSVIVAIISIGLWLTQCSSSSFPTPSPVCAIRRWRPVTRVEVYCHPLAPRSGVFGARLSALAARLAERS